MDDEAPITTDTQSMTRFWIIFAGQAFSLFGSRLVQFAIVWWITSSLGSASALALASIMAILPQVLLGPFAGVFVDRWDKRHVMILADLSVAALVLILAFLYTTGLVQLWHIYVIMFLRSLGGAFQWPAMQTTTALMVPKKHLSRVSGFNQALQGMANILAPPMGALLLEFLPVESVLYIDVATAVFAVAPLLVTRIPQPKVEGGQFIGVRSVIENLREGMLFVWNWKGLRLIIGISMALNLLMTPAFSLLPLLVTKHFGGGAIELAWIQSAGGLGMILGGLALGVWGGSKKRIVTAMIALILSGVFVTVLGLTPPNLILLAVASMFLFSFTNAIANSVLIAALQAVVPPKIQGRVWTLVGSLSMAMSPIGLTIAGPVADALGERIWFNIGGVAFIILGIASFMSPTLMNVEKEGANHQLPEET
jgi:DHA3 family macrolide efflux protein-like MFS transporter